MASSRALAVALLLLAGLDGHAEAARTTARTAARSSTRLSINPIRRVVTMLQSMQKKVVQEGKKDEELFDNFMCYCKNGVGDLEKSIGEAEAKVPMLDSSLAEGTAKQEQLTKDVAQHKQDRDEAKEALAKATAIREKEAAAFAKESSDSKSNIAALGKAITALEGGLTNFLQTSTGETLRRLTIDMDLSTADRDQLSSFLSQAAGSPGSMEIVDILKQMKETMEKELAEATSAEETAKAGFEAMTVAKEKEVVATTKAIEAKLQREGELGVEIEATKEDLDDTSKALLQDKQFLADLGKNCEAKKTEWEAVKKARNDELLAIGDTIKILNDDDSLDLLKKALPTPSLLQMARSGREVKQQALEVLRAARRGRQGAQDPRLDFVALALRGRKMSFEKIVSMIDDMMALLGREQKDDDRKKDYCTEELDKSENELKQLTDSISDAEKVAEDAKGKIETLAEEIKSLGDGIVALDKQVAAATEARKAEHKQYSEDLSTNSAAKELLKAASDRMMKFYAAQAPKEQEEVSGTQLLEMSFGGGSPLEEEQAPNFAQLASRAAARRARAVPPPPPEAVEAYRKNGQGGARVLEMLRVLATDVDKEIAKMEVEEKDAQAEYEELIADSAAKRAADAKSLSEKEGAKADLEAELQKVTLERKSKTAEAAAMVEIIRNLHVECDWLVSNYAVRKDARAGEVDALSNAKAVLSGADYSFVQTERRLARVSRA